MSLTPTHGPALIVIGGYPGAGKTALSWRLSSELRMPRLGSDSIGRAVRASDGLGSEKEGAFRIGYDVLFTLCREFLAAGISTIVDTNMGRQFQWDRVDAIAREIPGTRLLPVILRCPLELSVERGRQRYLDTPDQYETPDVFATDPNVISARAYLDRLDRPDAYLVDAARSQEVVYQDVLTYLTRWLATRPNHPVTQPEAEPGVDRRIVPP